MHTLNCMDKITKLLSLSLDLFKRSIFDLLVIVFFLPLFFLFFSLVNSSYLILEILPTEWTLRFLVEPLSNTICMEHMFRLVGISLSFIMAIKNFNLFTLFEGLKAYTAASILILENVIRRLAFLKIYYISFINIDNIILVSLIKFFNLSVVHRFNLCSDECPNTPFG